MPSDSDIVAVARVIRETYGTRAASLMESRAKDYARAGAWGRAEFWGDVARMVETIDAAESRTADFGQTAPKDGDRAP